MLSQLALLLALVPSLALSVPTAAGSKHNVYLVRCQPSDPDEDVIVAAAFFRDGPIKEGSTLQNPTALVTVSGSSPEWEGRQRRVRLDEGTFTTNISADAKKAAKGSIAGDAKLGSEPFVCFKDGTTKFSVRYDRERYSCTTDYWCPSIDVGDAN
ncbi:uncharacterized protein EI97DRAFT_475860 [Westerdykella ornata]|uniref:Uncharacterized protein n=1 Tax=Westerdykella ornata TaxID=318751 RepID=A0A6A6JF55_WESOR|nr:uncharacterized protein EI97DRAFT_475860 [Westerdykella ornata]KAF2275250.1 hypothetical protein EI97DRAFT_475860 [Westerdykella ornata]